MNYLVRLSPAAGRDLDRLAAFLEIDSPAAAARALTVLEEGLESLRDMASRGRPGSREGYRELVVPFGAAAYIIRYRVTANTVDVAQIRHSREGG